MKVAWISYDFSEYCVRHVNALAAEHDVLLVLATRDAADFEARVAPGVRFWWAPRPRLRQPLRQFLLIGQVMRQISDFEPDVVHFQHGHLWFNLVLPLLRRYPLVVTIHDPRHHEGDRESLKSPQAIMDFGYRRADRVIVHGWGHVDVVRGAIGIPTEKIDVVPHVAMGTLDATAAGLSDEEDGTVLFFGRIWEYKGLEYLIRAEPEISKQVPGLRIVVAGEGEDFCRYRKLMSDPSRFEVHNHWISDEERDSLFRRAAVVALPYVSASQSGVIPIAYSHSKPVVATRVGALPEYVEHLRTGLLVPPRDEAALARAIVSLLRDSRQRRAMGERGRRKLIEEWSPEVVARRTAEVYRLAIEGHAHLGRPRRAASGHVGGDDPR